MPYRSPEDRRAYHRDYKRLRRAGIGQTPSQTPLPAEFRLRKATDIIGLMEEQVALVRQDGLLSTTERARCLGFLATVALRAIESGDMAARLEAIEAVLKRRRAA